jgi:tRNA G18 (ribose-2'-O)-methylase SpoU
MPRKLTSPEILEKWKKNRSKGPFPLIVILDNLRSAYNVGSIFRTCECAGIQKLILCGITPCPPHKGIEKTALGTTQALPWEYQLSVLSTIEKLKKEGYTIACLEITDKSLPISEVKKDYFPMVLVIGNEVYGVSEAVLEASDLVLEIPLYGKKESLNVAVAAGVAIFTLIEKYQKFQT